MHEDDDEQNVQNICLIKMKTEYLQDWNDKCSKIHKFDESLNDDMLLKITNNC